MVLDKQHMSNSKSKLLFLFIIFGMVLLGITTSSLQKKNTFVSKAEGSCNCDSETCYPDCSRNKAKTDCPGGSGPDPQYMSDHYCIKPPQCCDDLATDGAAGCCWAERKYCLPSQCDKINGSRERCGAAYAPEEPWPLGCYGYGGQNKPTNTPNPIKPSNTPIPTLKPTKIPKPTKTPTPFIEPTIYTSPSPPFQPTAIPTNTPTQKTTEQNEPIFYTNNQSQEKNTQYKNPLTISASFILEPVKQIAQNIPLPQESLRLIDEKAPKPLNFFRWTYDRVTFYDRLLELQVNTTIHDAFSSFSK